MTSRRIGEGVAGEAQAPGAPRLTRAQTKEATDVRKPAQLRVQGRLQPRRGHQQKPSPCREKRRTTPAFGEDGSGIARREETNFPAALGAIEGSPSASSRPRVMGCYGCPRRHRRPLTDPGFHSFEACLAGGVTMNPGRASKDSNIAQRASLLLAPPIPLFPPLIRPFKRDTARFASIRLDSRIG